VVVGPRARIAHGCGGAASHHGRPDRDAAGGPARGPGGGALPGRGHGGDVHRSCGAATVGVDKGYSEVLVDTDGEHHGTELGELLRRRSDTLKERNARRATLRSIANQAAQRGRHGTAERIRRTNLGTITRQRQQRRWEQQVATVTYRAVNAVVDKARVIVAEDLSRTFTGRRRRGADTNRRWAAWTTGITAEALTNVSACGRSMSPKSSIPILLMRRRTQRVRLVRL
jgi:hypothetical protein